MSDDAWDEDELLQQIADGDMRALEVLYRAMRVRVYHGAPGYRPGTRARAWVLTIARHLALDAVRRRGRESAAAAAGGDAAAPGGEPDAVRLDLVNALLRLGMTDRQIVVLHDMAGLTHAEIAAELLLPAGTVRWRYRVALARLRPLVAEEEIS